MALPLVGLYDQLAGAGTLCPFDFTNNPTFFTIKPDARQSSTRQQRALSLTKIHGLEAVSEGVRGISFMRGAMTSGYRSVDFALDIEEHIRDTWSSPLKKGRRVLTTQDLSKIAPKSELVSRVVLPNIQQNLALAEMMAHQFPDHMPWAPAYSEAVERLKANNFNVTLGASTPDWGFEEFYIPFIKTRVTLMVAGLDHAHSRWANNEDLAATQTQLGFFDKFRDAKRDPLFCVDLHGRTIGLADRAWERARAIIYQALKGFEYDVALASLMGEFQYHRWLKDGTLKTGLHPDIANRSREDIERMDYLESMMVSLIANDPRFQGWVDWGCDADLKRYYEEYILGAVGSKFDRHQTIREITSYLPVGGFEYPEQDSIFRPKQGAENKVDYSSHQFGLTRPDQRRHIKQAYFTPRAQIFEDHLFDQLNPSVREQGSLEYILSTLESARLPVAAPRALFLIAALKGGEGARAYAQERGFGTIKEAQSVDGPDYAARVIEQRSAQRESVASILLQKKLINQAGFGSVYGTHTVDFLAQVVAYYPEFNATNSGERALTSQAKLLAGLEIMDRHTNGAVFLKGWQNDSDDLTLGLRAIMSQMGLIDRPAHGDEAAFILLKQNNHNEFVPTDIFELLPDVLTKIERDIEAGIYHRETLVSVLRMIHLFDMIDNPGHMNVVRAKDQGTNITHRAQLVDFSNLTGSFGVQAFGNHEKHGTLRARTVAIRQLIEETGLALLEERDLVNLPDVTRHAWDRAQGLIKKIKRPRRGYPQIALESLG